MSHSSLIEVLDSSEFPKILDLSQHPVLGRSLSCEYSQNILTSKKAIKTTAHLAWMLKQVRNAMDEYDYPKRDLLIDDFYDIMTVPASAALCTSIANILVYAPTAFEYLRNLFGIDAKSFMSSICDRPLYKLEKMGGSGSYFYISQDHFFVVKTVKSKEAKYVLRLLPKYVMNLANRTGTLLPKYFALFKSQRPINSLYVLIMSNCMPEGPVMQYDIKGSTYGRTSVKREGETPKKAFKDLDFRQHYPHGFFLRAPTYDWFANVIEKDCLILESFLIMDYSLLLGVQRCTGGKQSNPSIYEKTSSGNLSSGSTSSSTSSNSKTQPFKGLEIRHRLAAWNHRGRKVHLYVAFIDILQNYNLRKQTEHFFKSFCCTNVSVTRPDIYSRRFRTFLLEHVVKRVPFQLNKSSPCKPKFYEVLKTFESSETLPSLNEPQVISY